jgi:5-methylcytosine-specific restriction enzyme subunit McrC
VTFEREETLTLPGFLLDMNHFFQRLLGRFLSEHLPQCEVHSEQALRGMMRYSPQQNPRKRKAPMPRPDFVVKKGPSPVSVLDAKYRDLWERELPRDMLYQLAIYSLSQPRPFTASILFPTEHDTARPARIEIHDPMASGALGFVELRPVILPQLTSALAGERSAREALAQRLAFGGDA